MKVGDYVMCIQAFSSRWRWLFDFISGEQSLDAYLGLSSLAPASELSCSSRIDIQRKQAAAVPLGRLRVFSFLLEPSFPVLPSS